MSFKGVFSKIKDKICTFYKKDKKIFIAIIVCFVIFIGLIISIINDFGKDKTVKSNNKTSTESVSNFAAEVENKLEKLILKLDSVKTVSVFVMVESSPQITYLTETSEKIEQKENNTLTETATTVVFEKNGSSSSPIVVSTTNPKITGVLIVTNKISASTKLAIKNSISVVLNIDESCISLLQES